MTLAASARGTGEMIVSFAALMVLLELLLRALAVPGYILPAPSAVALALWAGLADGSYLRALWVTLFEILAGFALGSATGILLAIGITQLRLLERLLYPYVVAIQTVPKVAIAPLMIVWFGFGIQSKVLIVALTCLFPSLVNTIAGLRATGEDRLSLVRAMCGTRWHVLRYVQLPSALPYIMAGLNTGLVLAVIGAIVGEFVGAKKGIGVLILQANFSLDLASVFALLVVLGVTGVILNTVLHRIEATLCFWSGKG